MPTTTEYKPTLMEKLLGGNYKWWYLLQFRFKSRTISLIIYPQPSKLGEKIVNMLQLRVIYSQNKCENLAKFGIFASFLAVWFRVRI